MGYFGIQVHDKNGSICINSLLSFPAAGEDGENWDVFPWGGKARAWSSLTGLGVGSAGCCAGVPVLIPQHPTAQTMGKDVFPGRSWCFPALQSSCWERGSHPLPWIHMRVSYQESLTPRVNSQLVCVIVDCKERMMR